jgi:hypothetical protein
VTNSSENFYTTEVYVQKNPLIVVDVLNKLLFVKSNTTITQIKTFLSKLTNKFLVNKITAIPLARAGCLNKVVLTDTDHDIEFGRKGDVIRLWHDEFFKCSLQNNILLLKGNGETKEHYIVSDFPSKRPKGVRHYNAI